MNENTDTQMSNIKLFCLCVFFTVKPEMKNAFLVFTGWFRSAPYINIVPMLINTFIKVITIIAFIFSPLVGLLYFAFCLFWLLPKTMYKAAKSIKSDRKERMRNFVIMHLKSKEND